MMGGRIAPVYPGRIVSVRCGLASRLFDSRDVFENRGERISNDEMAAVTWCPAEPDARRGGRCGWRRVR